MKKNIKSFSKSCQKKSLPIFKAKSLTTKTPDIPCLNKNISVIGVGASAGGLEAIIALLKNLPTDMGASIIIIQHMEASRGSLLDEILARNTTMPVCFAKNKQGLLANHVYILPPDRTVKVLKGEFKLTKLEAESKPHHPIDAFFKVLAQAYENKVVGIILSGTGSDGVVGLGEIKALGGITFAQNEHTAQYPDMPHNAIISGNVDLISSPDEIAKKCVEISKFSHGFAETRKKSLTKIDLITEEPLKVILELLKQYSEVDFPNYKKPTLIRRIERRMILLKLDTVNQYLDYIKHNKLELKELYADVLINVTSFFRDPAVFALLREKIFPLILKHKSSKNPIRIWVPGVASGEEAYSIAIQMAEVCKIKNVLPHIQIFGTDISEKALAHARRGIYGENIKADVSEHRLRQYFIKTEEGFKITRFIRDMCVFARHDITRDPPFCNMDLISCRNVLIYLGNSLQKIVIPMLHYALKPGGMLLLSDAEGIGVFTNLFASADKKHKLFFKKTADAYLAPNFYVPRQDLSQEESVYTLLPVNKTAFEDNLLPEVSRILLNRFVSTSILINSDMELLQCWGDVSWCIQHKSGRATLNILQIIREELVADLRALILKAFKKKQKTSIKKIQFLCNAEIKCVDIEAIPVKGKDENSDYLLIVFKDAELAKNKKSMELKAVRKISSKGNNDAKNEEIIVLRESLKKNKEYTQTVIERAEATSEELKSSLEELQSSNEELHSTNEELQTAKEELQSTNEELKTMNEEINNRNAELNIVNNDILNLLNCINIPIIMVGRDLCIRRFNPMAEKFLSLIPRDIGRLITDIKPKLEISDLEKMIIDVVDNLKIQEREIQDKEGRWHLIQIRPYKTAEHKIEGAVITLIDIDTVRRTAELERLATIIRDSNDSILIVDFAGKITAWNKGAEKIYGWTEREALSMTIFNLIPKENIKKEKALIRKIKNGQVIDSFETKRIVKTGVLIDVGVTITALKDNRGRSVAISMTERDITKMLQERLVQGEKISALGLIAAGVAHELNSPLAGLMLMVNTYAKKAEKGTEDAENFNDMKEACLYMSEIIRDLSFFAKPKKERIEQFNVNKEIENVLKFAYAKIQEKKIKIIKDFDENIHNISGHKSGLQHIVLNLVSNACDSMSKNGKLIIRTSNIKNCDKIKIAVIDNGEGIPREKIAKIFEPFFTTKKKGSGLGLAIVKSLVNAYNGTISVETKENKGTKFSVIFPSLS
ncbi:MAG: chemotaxis protein CheB [Candidatus Omnitrophota bacterium]